MQHHRAFLASAALALGLGLLACEGSARAYSLGVLTLQKDTVVDGRKGLIAEVGVFEFDYGVERLIRGRQLILAEGGGEALPLCRPGLPLKTRRVALPAGKFV